jgi:hypothetical protein
VHDGRARRQAARINLAADVKQQQRGVQAVATKGDSHRLAEALAGKGVVPLSLTATEGAAGHQHGVLLSVHREG